MIDIYTERKDSKDWIFYNDLYFNLNTGNEEMSQKEIDLIQQVDEAKLTQTSTQKQNMDQVQSEIYHQAARHCLIL